MNRKFSPDLSNTGKRKRTTFVDRSVKDSALSRDLSDINERNKKSDTGGNNSKISESKIKEEISVRRKLFKHEKTDNQKLFKSIQKKIQIQKSMEKDQINMSKSLFSGQSDSIPSAIISESDCKLMDISDSTITSESRLKGRCNNLRNSGNIDSFPSSTPFTTVRTLDHSQQLEQLEPGLHSQQLEPCASNIIENEYTEVETGKEENCQSLIVLETSKKDELVGNDEGIDIKRRSIIEFSPPSALIWNKLVKAKKSSYIEKDSIFKNVGKVKDLFQSDTEVNEKKKKYELFKIESVSSDEEDCYHLDNSDHDPCRGGGNIVKRVSPKNIKLKIINSSDKRRSLKKRKSTTVKNLTPLLNKVQDFSHPLKDPFSSILCEPMKNEKLYSIESVSSDEEQSCIGINMLDEIGNCSTTKTECFNKPVVSSSFEPIKKNKDEECSDLNRSLSPVLGGSCQTQYKEFQGGASAMLSAEHYRTPLKGVPKKDIEKEEDLLASGSKRHRGKKNSEESLLAKFHAAKNSYESDIKLWYYENSKNVAINSQDSEVFTVENISQEYSNVIMKCRSDTKEADVNICGVDNEVKFLPNFLLILTDWGILNEIKISTGCKITIHPPWRVLFEPNRGHTWLLASPFFKVISRPLRTVPSLKRHVESGNVETIEVTNMSWSCNCYQDMKVIPDCSFKLPSDQICSLLISESDVSWKASHKKIPNLFYSQNVHKGSFANGRAYRLLKPNSINFIVTILTQPKAIKITSKVDAISNCHRVLLKDSLGEFCFIVLTSKDAMKKWCELTCDAEKTGQIFILSGFKFCYHIPVVRFKEVFDDMGLNPNQASLYHITQVTDNWTAKPFTDH